MFHLLFLHFAFLFRIFVLFWKRAVYVSSEMQLKAGRYCSAPWCNPWYLVCSLRLLRWKVEPGVDLLLREGLALKSGAGQRHREDILKFLFPSLTCTSPLHSIPSRRTRKQLASVIRSCTYFHHFISSVLFVCFSIMTKVLCPLVTALLITVASHLGARSWREKEGERDWEGPNVYHCRELNSRCGDNGQNKQTIMQK